jgi:FkbM family methyltransferase
MILGKKLIKIDTVLDLSLRKLIRKLYSLIGIEKLDFSISLDISNLLGKAQSERISDMPRFTNGYAEIDGIKIKFNDNLSFLGMLDEIFIKKNYLFSSKKKSPIIIDCGANIGLGVLYIKRIFPDAVIHAFEPDARAFDCLVWNVKSNNFTNVYLHKKAVWIANEELEFFSDGSWGGGVFNKKGATKNIVEAIDINSFLDSSIDFLKMDIEGAENKVIKHAAKFIVKNVDRFFFEWHSMKNSNQKLGEFLTFFEKSGFRYHIKEAAVRTSPFINAPSGEMDSQLDVFVYKNL